MISKWLKKADDYNESYKTLDFGPRMKRMKKAQDDDLNETLNKWMRQARSKNIHISGSTWQAKAMEQHWSWPPTWTICEFAEPI